MFTGDIDRAQKIAYTISGSIAKGLVVAGSTVATAVGGNMNRHNARMDKGCLDMVVDDRAWLRTKQLAGSEYAQEQ